MHAPRKYRKRSSLLITRSNHTHRGCVHTRILLYAATTNIIKSSFGVFGQFENCVYNKCSFTTVRVVYIILSDRTKSSGEVGIRNYIFVTSVHYKRNNNVRELVKTFKY